MLSTIVLEGRELRLVECNLSRTYGGLMLGHPNLFVNQKIYSSFEKEVTRFAGKFEAPHPVLVMPFAGVETLPGIQVIGVFESKPTGKATVRDDLSFGIVGWFQHGTEKVEVEFLKDLPWEEFARNGGY